MNGEARVVFPAYDIFECSPVDRKIVDEEKKGAVFHMLFTNQNNNKCLIINYIKNNI